MAIFTRTLTIGELINIDAGRVERAEGLQVKYIRTDNIVKKQSFFEKLVRKLFNKEKLIFYKIVRYEVKSNSGNTYIVMIKVSPGFNLQNFYKNKVQVFCTCADFKYRAAYELSKSENLIEIPATKEHLGIALTQAPTKVMTTPICKHVFAVINHFKTHLKELKLVY